MIVSASLDQTVRVWDTTGKNIKYIHLLTDSLWKWQLFPCYVDIQKIWRHSLMCQNYNFFIENLLHSTSFHSWFCTFLFFVHHFSGLRKKTVRGAPPQPDESNVVSRVNNELFGTYLNIRSHLSFLFDSELEVYIALLLR